MKSFFAVCNWILGHLAQIKYFSQWWHKLPLKVKISLLSSGVIICFVSAYIYYLYNLVPAIAGQIKVGSSSSGNSSQPEIVKYTKTGCNVTFNYKLNNKNGWNIPILSDLIRNLCQCVPDYKDYKVVILQRNRSGGSGHSDNWLPQDERRVTGETGTGTSPVWFGEEGKGQKEYYLVKAVLVKQDIQAIKGTPLSWANLKPEMESDEATFYRDDEQPSPICDPPGISSNNPSLTLPKTSTASVTTTPEQPSRLLIVDRLEDANNVNELGGYWYTYNDKGDSGNSQVFPEEGDFIPTSDGANGSNYSAGMTGNVTTAFPYGYIGMGTSLNQDETPIDLNQYTGIEFWAKGDGKTYRIKLPSSAISDYDHYGYSFTTTEQWSRYVVSFNSLTQEDFGVTVEKDRALSQVTGIQWQTIGQPHDSVELLVDEIRFIESK